MTGDVLTANFGNFGMRFQNVEPRAPYNNIASNGDAEMALQPWNRQYKRARRRRTTCSRAVAAGIELPGGTDQYKALAQFAQAGSLMQLALLYDKAFVVDETFDATKGAPQFSAYPDVAKAAQTKLDALIAATSGKTWKYSDAATILPLQGKTLDATVMNRVANTMAALLLDVHAAQRGRSGEGGLGEGAPVRRQGHRHGFGRRAVRHHGRERQQQLVLVHRVLRERPDVDAGRPARDSPDGRRRCRTSTPAPTSRRPATGDARLGTDYKFENTVIGDATRGIYMQSPYSHARYFYASQASPTSATGPVPYILAAESDLAKAEALVRTNGDLALAAQLINNTRVTAASCRPSRRPTARRSCSTAITYERVVETMATNGFSFFQVRHDDAVQAGTLRHMPVPAAELETRRAADLHVRRCWRADHERHSVGRGVDVEGGEHAAWWLDAKPRAAERPADAHRRVVSGGGVKPLAGRIASVE